jgi:vacuolar-type H+-ATPase subunit C/Vma6
MHNYIMDQGLRVLKPAILSFGTILAYIYLKELEVYTIRIAINSKLYGLTPEEVSMLIAWKR